MQFLQAFWKKDEDGAVTVDWVVLTAGVLLFAVAVGSTITDPVNGAVENIAATVDAQ